MMCELLTDCSATLEYMTSTATDAAKLAKENSKKNDDLASKIE